MILLNVAGTVSHIPVAHIKFSPSLPANALSTKDVYIRFDPRNDQVENMVKIKAFPAILRPNERLHRVQC